MTGQRVRTLHEGHQTAGWHQVVWRARDDGGHRLANGTYVYVLEAGDFRQSRKMTLLR